MTPSTSAPQKYDALARTYDRRWQRYHAETFSRAVRDVHDERPVSVLDVPCGTGELIRWLLPRVPKARIVGVDGSAAMLRMARQKWADQPQVSFQHALADALPFGEQTFDWVLCCSSLHYFRQPERVLAEFARVLKPAGRLLLLDWCRNPWHCRLIDWWKIRHDLTYVRMYTTHELRRLLQGAGWSVAQLERFRVSWIAGLRLWEMMEVLATPPPDAAAYGGSAQSARPVGPASDGGATPANGRQAAQQRPHPRRRQ
jgi:ubiquinone/menaquinone biosynthesis C-methylase UbiE